MMRRCSIAFILICITLISQAQQADSIRFSDDGKASYYARKFQGLKTASGEIFNNSDYTAAHRTLPFNTYLNVINKSNKFNVIVRVNDRGPYSKNRIIDLTEAAARRIGGYQKGVVKVKIEILDIIHLTPELEKKFNSGRIVDCYGKPAEPKGKSISLWNSTDLVHTIYVANDLFLKESEAKIFISHKYIKGIKKYHVLVSGIPDEKEAKKQKDIFERKGFTGITDYEL